MRKLIPVAAVVLLLPLAAVAQDAPRAELFGGYSYFRAEGGQSLHGWNASIAANLNRWFGLAVDFSGHYDSSSSTSVVTLPEGPTITTRLRREIDSYHFLIGPRFSYRRHERVTPFAHVMAGASRVHIESDVDIIGEDTVSSRFSDSDTAFAGAIGGGLDVALSDSIALRVIQAEYLFTRFGESTQDNARVSVGVVFRFGR